MDAAAVIAIALGLPLAAAVAAIVVLSSLLAQDQADLLGLREALETEQLSPRQPGEHHLWSVEAA